MAASIESQILVRIKALVEGLPQVKALTDAIKAIGRSTGVDSLGRSFAAAKVTSAELTASIKVLEAELRKLQATQASVGSGPGDTARIKEINGLIAEGQRKQADIAQAQHLAAVERIRKQRETIVAAQEAEKAGAAKVEAAAAADFNQRIAERIAKRKAEQAKVIAAAEESRAKISGTLAKIEGVSKSIGLTLLAPLRAVGTFVIGIFEQVVRQIQFAAAALVLFAASAPALAFGLLIKEGVEFLSVMEQQKIGLAALIQSTNDLFHKDQPNKPLQGIEAYNAATVVAAASTQRLSIKIIPLRDTLEDLVPVFNQIVTAGAAAGLTLEQTENVFTDFAATAQVINLPLDKLGTGIRLLLNGTARATTVLATALFGSASAANAWIKEHKAMGDLAGALAKKLEPFRLALLTSEQSFAVLAANTKDVFQRLAAIATSGLFEKLKASLVSILKSFYDLNALNIKPEFASLFDFINVELTRVGSFLTDLTDKVIAYLTRIALYVQNNRAYVERIVDDLVEIAKQLGLIIVEMGYVVADTFQAAKGTGSWADLLEVVARRIGSIHDAINVVIGAFQYLGGTIVAGVLAPVQLVADILGLISTRAAEAGQRIERLREAAKNYATFGASRFFSGINEEGRNNVIKDQLTRDAQGTIIVDAGPGTSEDNALHDIETRLKPFGSTKKAGGGGGRHTADKLANQLGELKKRTAELLRELFKSEIDIVRAGEDARFDLLQDKNNRTLDELDLNYKKQLTSTTDFYADKEKLQLAAINNEKKHLNDQFTYDQLQAISAIEELKAKYDALRSEPKNKTAGAQTELIKQEDIEKQKITNGLEEKRVKLNEQILILDGKQGDVQRKNAADLDEGLIQIQKRNKDIQRDILDEQGRAADAEIIGIAQQYNDILLKTLADSNPASAALKSAIEDIRNLGAVTSSELITVLDDAGIKFDDLSEETKALIRLMKSLESNAVFKEKVTQFQRNEATTQLEIQLLQDKLNTGKLSQLQYDREINAINQSTLDAQEDLLAQAYLLADTDEKRLDIKRQLEQLRATHEEVSAFAKDINGALRNDISSFADSVVDDFRHIGANFKKMAIGILQDIGKIIIQALVLQPLFQALGIGEGSSGGIGGKLNGFFGGRHANGGFLMGPGTSTSDSILWRGSVGEGIIPASSVQKYGRSMISSIINGSYSPARYSLGSGGSNNSAQLPPKVVIALNEDDIANASQSSAGERVWISHFNKNKRALGLA